MPDLDIALYKWICSANARLEDLDLPVGFVEDSIALLKQKLGEDYLEELLIADSSPIAVFDDESRQLRKWLLSARATEHVLQVLELAAYFKTFRDDPSLHDKIQKLKRDKFWPMFFELAIATRLKRACLANQAVTLNSEVRSSTGDFTISVAGLDIPCECSRLGSSPQITEPKVLSESLCHLIEDKTRRIALPLCIKIRSSEPLTGHTYNCVLRLVRRAMSDARCGKLPVRYSDGHTDIWVEILTSASEPIDYGNTKDWNAGVRLYSVPARSREEVTARFDQGERFREYESVRLFMKFAKPSEQIDNYSRLTTRIRKKLKQTKVSDRHMGKIVLIEVPFSIRTVDRDKLESAVRAVVNQSSTTLAVILAAREKNPQIRYHYSQSVAFNEAALQSGRADIAELVAFLNRTFLFELHLDPILGEPYRRSWAEAQARQATQRAE
ncbi:MAG TPA: hypothetical protein VGK01_22120 [Candidatus Angelobacter sp.]|jgi:hypothetical protein